MNYWLRRKLATPAFQDEEKARQADLLNKYSLAALVVSSVILIVQIAGWGFHGETLDVLRVLGVFLAAVVVQALLRRGRIRAGAIALIAFLWLAITLEVILFREGGYTLINYASLVILAGLVLGSNAMWTLLGVSVVFLIVLASRGGAASIGGSSSLLNAETLAVFVASVGTTTWMVNHALRNVRESGKTLRESEDRWQFALEGAGDGLWDWNLQSDEVFSSRQLKAMFGYEEHEIGRTPEDWDSRIHRDDKKLRHDDVDRCLKAETSIYRNEHRVRCRDGSYKWVLDRGKVTERSADGKPLRMIGVQTDISARKASEEQLRKAQEMLEQILDSVPQSVFWKDRNSVYLGCNHSFAKALGFDQPASVVGKSEYDVTPNRAMADAYRSDDLEVIESKQPKRHILELVVHPDGRDVWAETTKVPLVDKNGEVYGVLGVYDDITERKRSDEALKESRERAQRLSSAAFEGIGFAEAGRITDANEQLALMLGYSMEEIIGMPVMDFVAPESRATVMEHIRSGSEKLYEHLAKRKDGTIFPVEVQGRILSRQGEQIRVTAIRDITERKRAEQALHESEEGFRKIVESSPLGMHMYELRPDGKLVFTGANPAADFILGVENSQFIGKTIEEAFPPLADSEVPRQYREVAKSGKTWGTTQIDYEHERIRGAFEVVAFQITEGRMVAMFSDITERKQVEDSLKRERNLLRTLIDNLPQNTYVYIKDAQGRYVINNPAHLRSLGVAGQEDVLGKTSYDFFPPDLASQYFATEQEVIRSGQPLIDREEAALDLVTGEMRWHLTTKFPLRDPLGKISGLVGMSVDITGRKRAQDALWAEKQQLAVTLRSIGDGVITTDTHGRLVMMNKVAEALTGWSLNDALGRSLTEVFCIIHQETREARENPVDQVLKTKSAIELAGQTVLIARDGRELVVADSGAPILDDEGNITGVVLVFRDMTEKQKLLETAQRSQKLESLGVLAGGIAHDFNNMLGGIFGYIDMAKRKNADKEVDRFLERALGAFGRARDLTERLVTFSKGGSPVRKTSRIGGLLRDNTGFALSGSNVTCDFSISADLYLCDVDENQLSQVINNIVINAKQAMAGGGGINVRAENLELDEGNFRGLPGGRYIRISVQDYGVGIPKEILPRIFDPFFTTKPKGNGLGLATSYSIVQKHDGIIEVESVQGKGSTFHVVLPASRRDLVAADTKQAPEHRGSGTLLVMDDEESLLEILKDWLTTMGYSVIEAHNGEEVLELLARNKGGKNPVVGVILDLTIPGGRGGRETISEIRKRYPSLFVFASSGYSDDPVMSRPEDYGFSDSIKKPYRIEDLAGMLDKHFKK